MRGWALALALAGCGPERGAGREPGPGEDGASERAGAHAPVPPPLPPLPEIDVDDVHVDVLDVAALQALEAAGWSAGALLARLDGQPPPAAAGAASLATLAAGPTWGAVVATLGAEVDGILGALQWDVVTDHREAVRWPASNVSRGLDRRWLASPRAQLRLAGVVQRIDRRDLHTAEDCGELRFIYRLAYTIPGEDGAPARGSRLPFTLNAVFVPTSTDCADWARRWAAPPAVDGVLDPAGLRFDRFEVNAQVLRLPAGVATEAGGQAAYLLAVLDRETAPEGRVRARLRPLENTPDVDRIRADPALAAALRTWVQENTAAIDAGTHLLPARFLATRALSWSTAGTNRLANRPFSALFPAEARAGLVADAAGAGRRWVGDADGLVDRLDNSSCTGCHQAGSTAGFHLLGGDDPALAGVTNRVAVPRSPHLGAERLRRRQRTWALATGAPVDRHRAHSLVPAAPGPVGADQPCLPADQSGALVPGAAWGCGPGLACTVIADDPAAALRWGACVPAAEDGLRAGMSCRSETITARFGTGRRQARAGEPWALHAYADRFAQTPRHALPEDKRFSETALNCRPPVLGVPLGRTFRRCTAAERSLEAAAATVAAGGPPPAELCGVVGGSAFDSCVEGDFHGCLASVVGRGMVGACSADLPCREDRACQAIPWQLDAMPSAAGETLAAAGVGVCTPTYFLFQLRLDGHPPPVAEG